MGGTVRTPLLVSLQDQCGDVTRMRVVHGEQLFIALPGM